MYNEYAPCGLLSPYIDKYWEFKGSVSPGMHFNILPDGCTDFIFTLGEVANACGDALVMHPYRSYFVGPMTKYSQLVAVSNQGRLPIRTLADEVNICQRHFERKFKAFTGYAPKEYSRIMQFRNAVELLRHPGSGGLLSVAVSAGYYDVPHLSRAVRRLSGNTPVSFLSAPEPKDVTLTYMRS